MSAEQHIRTGGASLAAAINAGDAAGAAALYTADGAVLPPGAPAQTGRAAVQAFWQAAIDSGVTDVALTTLEVFEDGAAATEIGALSLTAGGASHTGKYVVHWRHEDGAWRLARDIWNLDA